MRNGRWRSGVVGLCFLVMVAGAVSAEEGAVMPAKARRFGIFIGSNDGGRERAGLRWAESDARALAAVFGEMGGIRREDNAVLTRPNTDVVRSHLRRVAGEMARAKGEKARTELVFYFSGHSDEEGLLLGRERYGYRALREDINAIPADMRIVILDSCASGAFTRAKGGVKTQAFLLDEQAEATGYAFLTSSSATEVSQESDRIRSSYFTHSLIAGLRGAADTIGNGRVTLNEAYRYAYDETLAQTETTLFGRQHPSYDIQINGSGDVVLTDLRATSAGLILDESIAGRLSVRDHDNFLIAEITKTQGKTLELALEPGRYRLTLRTGNERNALSAAEVTLEEDKRLAVSKDDFFPLDLAEAVARGDVDAETAETTETERIEGTGEAADDIREPRLLEPVRFQLFPGLETDRRDTTVNLLVGMFAAESYRLEGLALAAFGLSTRGDMTGAQFSGLLNFQGGALDGPPFPDLQPTGAEMRGAQFAGLGNWAGTIREGAQFSLLYNWVANSARGAQFSGVFNWTGTDLFGAQFAGLVNWSGGGVVGAQFAGLANWAGGGITGAQFAGLVNWVGGSITSGQFAGLMNYAGKGMTGSQIAGLVNVAWGATRGFQAGIINIRDKGSGGQLGLVNIAYDETVNAVGLVNIVKNGLFHPLVFTDNLARYNIGLKSGNKWLYSIIRVGVDRFDTDLSRDFGFTLTAGDRIVNTFGIGVEFASKKRFFVDLDLATGHIFSVPESGPIAISSFVIQARLGAGFKLFSHLGFLGGLTYTYFIREDHKFGFFAGVQF